MVSACRNHVDTDCIKGDGGAEGAGHAVKEQKSSVRKGNVNLNKNRHPSGHMGVVQGLCWGRVKQSEHYEEQWMNRVKWIFL